MGNRFFAFLSKCTENFGKLTTSKNSNGNASTKKVQIETEDKDPNQHLDTVFKNNFEFIVNDDNYFSKDENLYYEKRFPPTKYKENQTIRWKPGDFLGQGSFGKVTLGLNIETGEMMAVKQVDIQCVRPTNERVKSLIMEIDLLSKLDHPNIVRYLGAGRTTTKLNIFLEYVSEGSIAFLLRKYQHFNENIIRKYTTDILHGLEYLHWNKVLHRDIKGANVLVDNKGNCKLADFGSSKRISELYENDAHVSLKGTANWMAPEVIKENSVSRFSDIWSLGCMIIEMATGKPPWSQYKNPLTAMYQIAQSNTYPELPTNLSSIAIDFLLHCFKLVPYERYNCYKLLNHTFIVGNQQLYKNPIEIRIEKPNAYLSQEGDHEEKYSSISPNSFGTGQIRKKIFMRNSLESLPFTPLMQKFNDFSFDNHEENRNIEEFNNEKEGKKDKEEKEDTNSLSNEQMANKFSNVKNQIKANETKIQKEFSDKAEEAEEEINEEIKEEEVKMEDSFKNVFHYSDDFKLKGVAFESSTNYNNIIIEENL